MMEGASSSNPDIMSSIIQLLYTSTDSSSIDQKEIVRILKSISKVKGLSLMMMMLSSNDVAAVKDMLSKAAQDDQYAADAATLKSRFAIQ
jgi:Potential Monad-binding region of RPAP3